MKIAYLVMAHSAPEQIRRLADALNGSGDCYIHIDKKTKIAPFEKCLEDCKNAFLIKNRIKVNWAAFSMVDVYMKMLEQIYNYDIKYDRFVFLTGQDYPLMSNSQILHEFESHPETEYIMAYKISTSIVPTDKNKILKRWYFENPFTNRFLRKVWYSLTYRFITQHTNSKKLTVPLGGVEVEPYFGKVYSAFTRKGVECLLSVYLNDKHFNKAMKHVHAPDEIYYHTVIFNSELKKNTIENGQEHHIEDGSFGWAPLHYHTYDVYCSEFEEKDFETLKNCGYMFCRKVIPGKSDTLMDKIDEMRRENDK